MAKEKVTCSSSFFFFLGVIYRILSSIPPWYSLSSFNVPVQIMWFYSRMLMDQVSFQNNVIYFERVAYFLASFSFTTFFCCVFFANLSLMCLFIEVWMELLQYERIHLFTGGSQDCSRGTRNFLNTTCRCPPSPSQESLM